jgi:nucleoside-diphosphate-sugar epimerase
MTAIKVIITGATGMVGEGVLFECLQNPTVSEVLIINRRHYGLQHPKLKELIVPDFFQLNQFAENVRGHDACFFLCRHKLGGHEGRQVHPHYL